MKQKATVGGRSFFFNLLFVLFNLTGLTLVVIGSHKKFEDYFILLSFIGYLLIALSSAGLLIFQGRLMMANVARVFVGSLFIVSGLIKANDPIGFSYKLEEYFEDGALAYRIKELFGAPGFSLDGFVQYALVLSVLICIVEIVLGVMTIIGGKIKLVSYSLMIMMLFFTFLTWHTANCDSSKKFIDRDTYETNGHLAKMKLEEAKTNKDIKIISKSGKKLIVEEKKHPQCVEDCGCFGDAMKGSIGRSLTPHESMWKDFVLLYLVLWIFISQWIIEPNDKKKNIKFIVTSALVIIAYSWIFSWFFPIIFGLIALIAALWMKRAGGFVLGNYFGASLIVGVLSLLLIAYVLLYEPIKDYRPYSVGSNLQWKMNDGIEGKYESVLVYKNKKTGEKIEYLSTSQEYIDSKIWEDPNWAYLEMTQKEIIPSRIPSITEQFNPFLNLSEISANERKLEVIQKQLADAQVTGYRIKDLGNNSSIEISAAEYNVSDFPDTKYKILDTIQFPDPSFTEVNIRNYIIEADWIFILSVKNLSKANWNSVKRYKSIYRECQKRKIPFVVICNGSRSEIDAFRKKHNFNVPVFVNDETELKTIARSNPSLLVIQKGIVKGKFPHRSTPTFNWLENNTLK